MTVRRLSEVTTLRVGGPAGRFVDAETDAQLVDAVRTADAAGEPVLVMGGGSNLLVCDAGVDGLVVRVATQGRTVTVEGDEVVLDVAAGADWDALVTECVGSGWAGIEALSGIPGRVGATPIQNVGAYGQELADVLVSVRAWDRRDAQAVVIDRAGCGCGYRSSAFKADPDRWVVLGVILRLARSGSAGVPAYADLRQALGAGEAPLASIREAVLELRRGKGMVLDPADHDTWSAGSFFVNPVLDADAAAALPTGAPRWPQPDGRVKTSAAWLIEQSGFAPGWSPQGSAAAISGRHTLAITNRGTATAADVVAVARAVRDGVLARFAVALEPEPRLVGLAL